MTTLQKSLGPKQWQIIAVKSKNRLTNHNNTDIQAMWLILPFYDFCCVQFIAVNSVCKVQFLLRSAL